MGVNSLPKTVIRQRRNCDLNPGPSAPESSTLTSRLYCMRDSGVQWRTDGHRETRPANMNMNMVNTNGSRRQRLVSLLATLSQFHHSKLLRLPKA